MNYINQTFRVIRNNNVYDGITLQQIIENSLQLDSDIYEYGEEDFIKKISNKSNFLKNSSFKDEIEITNYLREHGKIPSFLEIRKSDNHGYGVFTTKKLEKGIFLGFYDGIRTKLTIKNDSEYLSSCQDFEFKDAYYIDGENIIFSNWPRFLNDFRNVNKNYTENTVLSNFNHHIHVYTCREINVDEELFIDYGEKYWNGN